jgi:DNA-directed RNA polymerases I, II, and III subunit RPABC2
MDSDTSDLEEIMSNDSDSYDTDDESSFTINPNTIVHSNNIPDTSTSNIQTTIELDEESDEFPKINHLDVKVLHPELTSINYKELLLLSKVKKDKDGNIIDNIHKTLPILTKYEKTKILGQRAKQIEEGHQPFIKIDNIIDHYTIAQMELEQNKIPFIIRRPIPNGQSEYWRVQDLLIL